MSETEELLRQIAANLSAAQSLSSEAEEVQAELATLTGTARSEDRLVEVTVDSRGMPTAIRIEDDAEDLGAQRLGATVMQTTQAAIADLRQKGEPIRRRVASEAGAILAQGDLSDRLIDAMNREVRR